MTCGDPKCDRYSMTVAEFKLLRGEQWGWGFDAQLGWAAKKLCLQLFEEAYIEARGAIGTQE